MSDSKIHSGHRKRMFKRYSESGGDFLEDHELLELLLCFSIPRVNTNELSHRLINEFGSFDKVIEADVKALGSVDGIGPRSALLIKLCSDIVKRYTFYKHSAKQSKYDRDSVGKALVEKFRMENHEKVLVMLFDNSGKHINTSVISEGTVNASEISVRKILEVSLKFGASFIVLAHNHPSGTAEPSDEDMMTTLKIRRALIYADIELIEHFVIAGDEYYPIIYNEIRKNHSSEQ